VLHKATHNVYVGCKEHIVLNRTQSQIAIGANIDAATDMNPRVGHGNPEANAGVLANIWQGQLVESKSKIITQDPWKKAEELRITCKDPSFPEDGRFQDIEQPYRENNQDEKGIKDPLKVASHSYLINESTYGRYPRKPQTFD
jgi:hypothetical protein